MKPGYHSPLKAPGKHCAVIHCRQKQFSGRRLYLGSRFSERSSGPAAHGRVTRQGACREENCRIDGEWEAERKGQDKTVCKYPWCPDFFSSYAPARSEDGGFLACLLWRPLGGGWSFKRQRWRTTGWLNAEPYGVPPISWMESVPHDEATDLFGMSWVPAGSKRATAGQDDLEGLVSLYKQSKSSYVAVKLHTKTYQGSQALPHSSRLFVCARSLEVC